MAITQTKHNFSLSGLDCEFGELAFTSTTATHELTTGLSEIYGAPVFNRIGPVDASDAGYLSTDETSTAGVITVSGGAITVVRQPLLAAGTLTDEKFGYIVFGKS